MTLGAPIGGGRFHDTLSAPGAGDVVIAGTPGNDVSFAAVQYYDGSTTVEKGAVLRLGSGKRGGDGGLSTGGTHYRLVNDGALVLRNTGRPVILSRVTGSGSLTQSGTATATLTGEAVTYTGPTTVATGTLALRGGASLTRSRAIRLSSAGARLDAGRTGLRVATRLTGKGTVSGAVTNDGTVTTGLTVNGPYTQSPKGSLVLRSKQLTVTGRVRLAGDLDVSSAPQDVPEITVLDHRGRARTSGTFTGLKEGARLKPAGTAYRLTYRGGDGNDVVLTADRAPRPSPTLSAPSAVAPRGAGAAEHLGFGWWPYALGSALVISLAVPVAQRRGRGHRRGGRHAGRARR